ncbi:hypothetical protein [Nostoc sp. UHCC 0302]|uniref:hypothetical protein n=1 Tax=Nostoc sp. UHCC 0302 TaxID=3134896 RepID=UPI00311C8979
MGSCNYYFDKVRSLKADFGFQSLIGILGSCNVAAKFGSWQLLVILVGVRQKEEEGKI